MGKALSCRLCGLPPAAPMGGNLGLGQAMAGGGARGKDDYLGQARSVMGGAVSLIEQGGAAFAQAKYQDEMNTYQREMARHGRPRVSPDEVSTLIRKKDDVVADHMICFVFGREPLLITPAPFFRSLPFRVEKGAQNEPIEVNFHRLFKAVGYFFMFSGVTVPLIVGFDAEIIPLGMVTFAIGAGVLWLSRRFS